MDDYESALKSLSLKTRAISIKRSKLLDGCYKALNEEAVITLRSLLLLSQDLEDVYKTILGSRWHRTASKPIADDLLQKRREGINYKIEAVQHSLARLDSSASTFYSDLVSLGTSLNEHYNGKVLSLQRSLSATRTSLEDDLSHVAKELEEGKCEENSLELRTKELLAQSENLEDARSASDKRAKAAAETGICSLVLGVIFLILGLAIFPLFIAGLGMLGCFGAQGGVHWFASKQSAALDKEINAVREKTEKVKESISTLRNQLIEKEGKSKEFRVIFQQISDMSSQTEQLCASSREVENLFANDQVLSTDNLCTATRLAHLFETMKFKSTQLEVLRLIKLVAKNVTYSVEHKDLLLNTTRPERTALQKLSCLLEKSLRNIEFMCPAVSKLIQDEFDEELHRKIKEIAPCGMREPLWTTISTWSIYLVRHWTNMLVTASYQTLLSHSHFFTYLIGGWFLALALWSGYMLEQVLVVWSVVIIFLHLPSLPKENSD